MWELFRYLDLKSEFCHSCSRFLFLVFLGLDLDVWDWKTKHSACEELQTLNFAEAGILVIPGSIFHDSGSVGTNFYDFCYLGDSFEICDFSK